MCAGTCTTSASLPTLSTPATGRTDYMTLVVKFPAHQMAGITLASNNGFYVCNNGNFPMSIYGIYLVKK